MAAEQPDPEVLKIIVDAAQDQIDRQLKSSDSHDVKSIGLLAANLASVAAAIALSPHWTSFWIAAIVAVAISSGSLIIAIRGVTYNVDPDIVEFYDEYSRSNITEAGKQLIAKLIEAIGDNKKELHKKRTWFVRGAIAMLADVTIGAAILVLLHTGVLS